MGIFTRLFRSSDLILSQYWQRFSTRAHDTRSESQSHSQPATQRRSHPARRLPPVTLRIASCYQHFITGRVTSLAVESQERHVDKNMQDNEQPEDIRGTRAPTNDHNMDSLVDHLLPTPGSAQKPRSADIRRMFRDPKFACEANPHGLEILGPLVDVKLGHTSEDDGGFEFVRTSTSSHVLVTVVTINVLAYASCSQSEPFEGFDALPKFCLPFEETSSP